MSTVSYSQADWNEALERVTQYLDSFALGDRAHVARLALKFLEQAKQIHLKDSSLHPTTLTLNQAQKLLTEWLAVSLNEQDKGTSQVLADGAIAVLLSRVFQTAPDSFLAGPPPEELRQALREQLLVTGPDLNLSRMTPRHLDYGPMLGLARQTWHRWNAKEVLAAVLFWAAVYGIFYWWLSNFAI